jgi:hypothetical protein
MGKFTAVLLGTSTQKYSLVLGAVLRRSDGDRRSRRKCSLRIVSRPQSEFGSVCDANLPENSIEVFLDRSLRNAQLERDLFVGLGLLDQFHDLPLAKREFTCARSSGSGRRGLFACLANVFPSESTECATAARAGPRR